jgi:hypothetical protein
LKPDALRLDRDNAKHLVGRAETISIMLAAFGRINPVLRKSSP